MFNLRLRYLTLLPFILGTCPLVTCATQEEEILSTTNNEDLDKRINKVVDEMTNKEVLSLMSCTLIKKLFAIKIESELLEQINYESLEDVSLLKFIAERGLSKNKKIEQGSYSEEELIAWLQERKEEEKKREEILNANEDNSLDVNKITKYLHDTRSLQKGETSKIFKILNDLNFKEHVRKNRVKDLKSEEDGLLSKNISTMSDTQEDNKEGSIYLKNLLFSKLLNNPAIKNIDIEDLLIFIRKTAKGKTLSQLFNKLYGNLTKSDIDQIVQKITRKNFFPIDAELTIKGNSLKHKSAPLKTENIFLYLIGLNLWPEVTLVKYSLIWTDEELLALQDKVRTTLSDFIKSDEKIEDVLSPKANLALRAKLSCIIKHFSADDTVTQFLDKLDKDDNGDEGGKDSFLPTWCYIAIPGVIIVALIAGIWWKKSKSPKNEYEK